MEGVGGGEIKINSFFLNLMAVTQPSPAREGFFCPSCVATYALWRGLLITKVIKKSTCNGDIALFIDNKLALIAMHRNLFLWILCDRQNLLRSNDLHTG